MRHQHGAERKKIIEEVQIEGVQKMTTHTYSTSPRAIVASLNKTINKIMQSLQYQ